MKPIRPIALLNHPQTSPLAAVIREPEDRQPVTRRAWQYLITQHNVSPDRAKEWLGLAK
jgi:hypothetical protein